MLTAQNLHKSWMIIWKIVFPDILKNGDISPCFKKGDKSETEIQRPISIFPKFSFEKLIHNQLNESTET